MSEETSSAQSAEVLMETLRSFVGKLGGESRISRYPIDEAMIHHWCEAIGDQNASYLDPEFAKTSIHGGIVTPPTMLQAWTMPGLQPRTQSDESTKNASSDEKSVLQVLDEAGFTSVVATNCEQEYFRYLKPGDRLTHDVEIESVSPEKRTGLGVGHFLTQLYKYRDANGELVGQMRFRLLKFRPPTGDRSIVGPRIPGGRPRPSLNQDVSFFWEGAAKGQLLIQRCVDCQTLRHPPGPGCPHCSSMKWGASEMSGKGEIYSFVRHHHPKIPPFETGHPVILVQLDEGPRLVSELAGHDTNTNTSVAAIEIGMRVEVQFDEVEEGFIMPRFRIVAQNRTNGTE
jgi:uncharacterized OB-fold protein/acyl dehydratase